MNDLYQGFTSSAIGKQVATEVGVSCRQSSRFPALLAVLADVVGESSMKAIGVESLRWLQRYGVDMAIEPDELERSIHAIRRGQGQTQVRNGTLIAWRDGQGLKEGKSRGVRVPVPEERNAVLPDDARGGNPCIPYSGIELGCLAVAAV